MKLLFVTTLAVMSLISTVSFAANSPSTCTTNIIADLTNEYFIKVTIFSDAHATYVAEQIQDNLKAGFKEGGYSCFQARAYTSLYQTLRHIEKIQSRESGQQILFSDILMRYVVTNNLFVPINFETRKTLGGRWKKTIDQHFQNIGAYDCTTQKIYVDMTHDPLNVAGVFIHEVSHLLFDRLAPQLELNNSERKLLDETLAVVLAGAYQLQISRKHLIDGTHSIFNYETPNLDANKKDMTLFRSNGPLNKSWAEFINKNYEQNVNSYMTSYLLTSQLYVPEIFSNVGSIYLTSKESLDTYEFIKTVIKNDQTHQFMKQIYSTNIIKRLYELPKTPSRQCKDIRHGNEGVRTEDSLVRACIHNPYAY